MSVLNIQYKSVIEKEYGLKRVIVDFVVIILIQLTYNDVYKIKI
jgi:hypothetical protein